MADNITIGSNTYATDDVGGLQYPVLKIAYGAPDSATLLDTKPATEAAQTLGTAELIALNTKVKAGAQTQDAGVGVSDSSLTVITGVASAALQNTDILTDAVNGWLDVSAFSSACLMITTSAGITAGTLTIEHTNSTSVSPAGAVTYAYDVSSLSASPASSITLAASTTKMWKLPLSAKFLRVRANVAVVGGTVQAVIALSQRPFTNSTLQVMQTTGGNLNAWVQGATAHSNAATGNPVQVGGVVKTTVSTTEASGDVARVAMSTSGAAITIPFSVPELNWSGFATVTDGSTVALKTAGAASVRNYCTGIDFINTSAVATVIELRDGASTVLWRGYAPASMTQTTTVVFPTPKRGTAATALNIVAITTGANIYVNAGGYSDV